MRSPERAYIRTSSASDSDLLVPTHLLVGHGQREFPKDVLLRFQRPKCFFGSWLSFFVLRAPDAAVTVSHEGLLAKLTIIQRAIFVPLWHPHFSAEGWICCHLKLRISLDLSANVVSCECPFELFVAMDQKVTIYYCTGNDQTSIRLDAIVGYPLKQKKIQIGSAACCNPTRA
jgi:hypothetical protein